MTSAPFFEEIIGAADAGLATWVTAADGVRLRMGHWHQNAPRGTVLLFPGRTEYIEKYAPTATALGARGYATLAIDWRGQGIADRACDDRLIGHVENFSDFQLDVAAMVGHAKSLALPAPYYLLGHSMGGCIGLRALYSGLDVQAACFTGPMWGIKIAPHLRPVAWGMGAIMQQVSKGMTRAPGTSVQSYVNITPFEGNMLTKNAETYAWMREQLQTQPDLALGGPSLSWLIEGLRECRDLAKLPAPTTPCLTFMGTDERIVEKPPIVSRMAGWKNGSLEIIPKAEHEILMEIPKTRDRAIDQIAVFFAQYAAPSTSL